MTCTHAHTDESYDWDPDTESEVPFQKCSNCGERVDFTRIQGYHLAEGDFVKGLGEITYTFQTPEWQVVFEAGPNATTHSYDMNDWFDIAVTPVDQVFDLAIRALRKSEPRLARLLWGYATNECIIEG